MGSCFSSGGCDGDETPAGQGVETRRRRVWPSDEDGRWPYVGERDVDDKASVFIANFHRHQSGACDCDDPKTPPAAAAPA
jgi:hypothetical protein